MILAIEEKTFNLQKLKAKQLKFLKQKHHQLSCNHLLPLLTPHSPEVFHLCAQVQIQHLTQSHQP